MVAILDETTGTEGAAEILAEVSQLANMDINLLLVGEYQGIF